VTRIKQQNIFITGSAVALYCVKTRVKIGGGCGGWTPTGKQITFTANAREKS